MRQAKPGEHEIPPAPVQLPASPTNARTPSDIVGAFWSEYSGSFAISRPSMVENTSAAEVLTYSIIVFSSIIVKSLPRSDDAGQFFFDLLGRERFADVADGAELHRFENLRLSSFGSDHHDRNVLPFGIGFEFTQKLQAIHVRHVDVREDQFYFVGAEACQCFNAIPRLVNLSERKLCLLQHAPKNFTDGGRVVDDENVHCAPRFFLSDEPRPFSDRSEERRVG